LKGCFSVLPCGQKRGTPPLSITPCGTRAYKTWRGSENPIGNWSAFKTDADGADPWAATQSRDHNLVNELTAIGGSSTHVGYGKPPSGQMVFKDSVATKGQTP